MFLIRNEVIKLKKIGILTMQRVLNYGSFLQAYSLKKLLTEYGSVEFVDYEYEKTIIDDSKKLNLFQKIIKNINFIYYLKKKKHLKSFRNRYSNYLSHYLNVNNKPNYYPKIDNLVIGSDEVFNCMQKFPVGYSRNLFGKGYEYCDIISYAASFGHTKLKDIKEKNIDRELSYLLRNFKGISVRDNNSYEIIKKLTNINSEINLDPVLVGDFAEEMKNIEINLKNYIILYAYTDRITKEEELYIKKFAKTHKKKIVSIGFYQKIADYNLIVNPFELLKYIKNADFVITDTFHGSVFSIKMNTKFCTIIRKSNYNKLYYLLEKLHHKKQMINKISDIEKIYKEKIDFTISNKIIENETIKTKEFLKKHCDK